MKLDFASVNAGRAPRSIQGSGAGQPSFQNFVTTSAPVMGGVAPPPFETTQISRQPDGTYAEVRIADGKIIRANVQPTAPAILPSTGGGIPFFEQPNYQAPEPTRPQVTQQQQKAVLSTVEMLRALDAEALAIIAEADKQRNGMRSAKLGVDDELYVDVAAEISKRVVALEYVWFRRFNPLWKSILTRSAALVKEFDGIKEREQASDAVNDEYWALREKIERINRGDRTGERLAEIEYLTNQANAKLAEYKVLRVNLLRAVERYEANAEPAGRALDLAETVFNIGIALDRAVDALLNEADLFYHRVYKYHVDRITDGSIRIAKKALANFDELSKAVDVYLAAVVKAREEAKDDWDKFLDVLKTAGKVVGGALAIGLLALLAVAFIKR